MQFVKDHPDAVNQKWHVKVNMKGKEILGICHGYYKNGLLDGEPFIEAKTFIFDATLYFKSIQKGNSSVNFKFLTENNVSIELNQASMQTLIKGISTKSTKITRDGGFKRQFTFKYIGGCNYIIPYEK